MKRFSFLALILLLALTLLTATSCKASKPEVNEYTVSFNTVGAGKIPSQTVKEGEKLVKPTQPKKEGYTFEGWYNGEKRWSFITDTVTENMTLRAKWALDTSLPEDSGVEYTVTFDTDGGGEIPSQTVKEGGKVIKPENPKKEGYTLEGWYLDGEKWSFITGTVSKSITLKAQWIGNAPKEPEVPKAPEYNVSFETDGGEKIPSQTVVEGGYVTMPTDPTKDGYDFIGWYAGSNEWSFEQDTVRADLILIAKWRENSTPKYTVAFDTDGAGDVPAQTVREGAKVTRPSDPSKAGYIFNGWYVGINEWNFDSDTVTKNITLTAKWKEVPTQVKEYTVTFDTDGAGEIPSQTVKEGETVTRPDNPTKSGYTFGGWFLGTQVWSFTTDTVTKNITLKAKWTENAPVLKSYTVTFDTDGAGKISAQSIKEGGKVMKPDDPTKSGYTFVGWFDGEKKWFFDTDTVTSDITLKARWTENAEPELPEIPEDTEYTVTFEVYGQSIPSVTVTQGTYLSEPTIKKRAGYVLGGWECDGSMWDFKTDTVMGDITLTAMWNECNHTSQSSGKCNYCTANSLDLISDGELKFRIVIGSNATSQVHSTISSLKRLLERISVELVTVEETDYTDENDGLIDILVGTGDGIGKEYVYNTDELGSTGYAIKAINNKLLICTGSPTELQLVFSNFVTNVLKITASTKVLEDVSLPLTYSVIKTDSPYPISSITIGGNDIAGYTIAVDSGDEYFYPIAIYLQSAIKEYAGYSLSIVPLKDKGAHSIVIERADRDTTYSDSFRVYVYGTSLHINAEYPAPAEESAEEFIDKFIRTASGSVKFEDIVMTKDISYVTYEMFGAKGDGRTNDFESIKAAHDYANESGQRVLGKSTAVYYIGSTLINGSAQSIVIKTPTDWQGAHFIVDDTNLHQTDGTKQFSKELITVKSNYTSTTASSTQLSKINAGEKLGPNTTRIDLSLGYRALLNIINKNHKVYVRYGGNANTGAQQHELVIVDENGYIMEGTELLLDYEKVTSIEIYQIDDEYMEIKNGSFTTKASRVSTTQIVDGQKTVYRSYFKRNIVVARSNTTVRNVNHYVEGEFTVAEQATGLTGPSYSGFFSANNADSVTFEDCIMTGRRYYKISGTYGFGATLVNNVVLRGCMQTNFYKADGKISTSGSEYWGLGGTNFCKNMIYDNCEVTRFDAHAGLYNGKLINTHVGMINLIGGGDMLIENSIVEDNEFFTLRTDYGATWKGTVTIKDSTLKNNSSTGRILTMVWTNHDFGYVCHYPNLILDNITHTKSKTFNLDSTSDTSDPNQDTITSWGDYIHIAGVARSEYAAEELTGTANTTNINPIAPPDFIIAKNCPGITLKITSRKFFSETVIRGFSGYPAYDPSETFPW